MKLRFFVMVATAGLVLISLLGCAGPSPTAERIMQPDTKETGTAAPSPSARPSDTPLPIELEPQATKPPPALTLVPQRVPTVAPDPVTGQVPQDLLDAILADAQARTGLARAQITVLRAEAVTWRDGSLGCPQPGMMYTMALVAGYQIVLRVGEETFDYHASERGSFVLCPKGMAQEPLPPGEGGLVVLATPPAGIVEEVPVPTSPAVPTPASAALQRVLDEVKQDLALRLDIPPEQIGLVEFSPVVWPDGALGCPEPGVDYTQVQVEGLLIRLRAGKQIYPYHSGGGTPPFLCEQAIEDAM